MQAPFTWIDAIKANKNMYVKLARISHVLLFKNGSFLFRIISRLTKFAVVFTVCGQPAFVAFGLTGGAYVASV